MVKRARVNETEEPVPVGEMPPVPRQGQPVPDREALLAPPAELPREAAVHQEIGPHPEITAAGLEVQEEHDNYIR